MEKAGILFTMLQFPDFFILFHAVCNEHEASVGQLEYLYSVMVKKVSYPVCKVILYEDVKVANLICQRSIQGVKRNI